MWGGGGEERPPGAPGSSTAAQRHAAPATLLRALDVLEWRLASREHVLGSGELTWSWVTLVQLDTVHRCHLAAAAVHITEHARLWACAWGLAAHPTSAAHLDLDGIARRYPDHCRAKETARAAVQIVDWMAYHWPVVPIAEPPPAADACSPVRAPFVEGRVVG